MEYDIYVDGACSGNGLPFAIGGWSYVVCRKDTADIIGEFYGKLRVGNQNSNRAEIEAVIQALKYIESNPGDSYNIYTDCTLVRDGVRGECSKKNNKEMWKEVEYLCTKIIRGTSKLDIRHIKQNKQNHDYSRFRLVLNNKSDKLAKKACENLLLKPAMSLGTIEEIQEKINSLLLSERRVYNG